MGTGRAVGSDHRCTLSSVRGSCTLSIAPHDVNACAPPASNGSWMWLGMASLGLRLRLRLGLRFGRGLGRGRGRTVSRSLSASISRSAKAASNCTWAEIRVKRQGQGRGLGQQGHHLHVDAVALGAGLAPADTDGPLAQHAALHRLLGLLRVLPVAEAHKAVVLTLRQTAGQSSRLGGRRRVRRYGDPRVRAVGQTGACVRCARVGAKRGGKRAPS